MGERKQVFISYSRRDAKFAKGVLECLVPADTEVFLDSARIVPGQRFPTTINDALQATDLVYVLWCWHSRESSEVAAEYRTAIGYGKPVVPVMLDTTPLPKDLKEIQGIDFRGTIRGHSSIDPRAWPVRRRIVSAAAGLIVASTLVLFPGSRVPETAGARNPATVHIPGREAYSQKELLDRSVRRPFDAGTRAPFIETAPETAIRATFPVPNMAPWFSESLPAFRLDSGGPRVTFTNGNPGFVGWYDAWGADFALNDLKSSQFILYAVVAAGRATPRYSAGQFRQVLEAPVIPVAVNLGYPPSPFLLAVLVGPLVYFAILWSFLTVDRLGLKTVSLPGSARVEATIANRLRSDARARLGLAVLTPG